MKIITTPSSSLLLRRTVNEDPEFGLENDTRPAVRALSAPSRSCTFVQMGTWTNINFNLEDSIRGTRKCEYDNLYIHKCDVSLFVGAGSELKAYVRKEAAEEQAVTRLQACLN